MTWTQEAIKAISHLLREGALCTRWSIPSTSEIHALQQILHNVFVVADMLAAPVTRPVGYGLDILDRDTLVALRMIIEVSILVIG